MDLETRIDAEQNKVRFTVNPKIYNLEAVMQAAYTFVDRAYLLLDKDEEGRFVVQMRGRNAGDKADLDGLAGEFQNELLHAAFRDRLTRRTLKVREMIVGRALFAAGGNPVAAPAPAAADAATEAPAPAGPPEDALPDVPLPDLPEEVLKDLEKLENMDYMQDPLGIAVPWEDKYKKDKGQKAASADAGDTATDAPAAEARDGDSEPDAREAGAQSG